MLILLLPAFMLLVVTIAILSRRSPLVAHRRVGLRGESFWMLKFRTMWERSTPAGPWQWLERVSTRRAPAALKSPNDPRVSSRFAAWCRKYSLDEAPQLWHVVTGRMALIGPRPITAVELRDYYGDSAGEVLTVLPGISGLWQVLGRNRLTYGQRLRLDLFFVRRRCLGLYWAILKRTPLRVLTGADAG